MMELKKHTNECVHWNSQLEWNSRKLKFEVKKKKKNENRFIHRLRAMVCEIFTQYHPSFNVKWNDFSPQFIFISFFFSLPNFIGLNHPFNACSIFRLPACRCGNASMSVCTIYFGFINSKLRYGKALHIYILAFYDIKIINNEWVRSWNTLKHTI